MKAKGLASFLVGATGIGLFLAPTASVTAAPLSVPALTLQDQGGAVDSVNWRRGYGYYFAPRHYHRRHYWRRNRW